MIHRKFQWCESAGVSPRVCTVIQSHCDELGGVDWEWQSSDTVVSLKRMMNAEPGLVDTGSHIILIARQMRAIAGENAGQVIDVPARKYVAFKAGDTLEQTVRDGHQ